MRLPDNFKIKSLAILSDFIPAQHESEITDYKDCIAIKTVTQPDFFWGNYLVFRRPPGKDSLEIWKSRYRQIFQVAHPRHCTFTWDISEINEHHIQPFVKDGFKFNVDSTLIATQPVRPMGFNGQLTVEPIELEKDWQAILEVHFNPNLSSSYDSQTGFIKKRLKTFRMLSEKGIGHRFGAFLDGKLVGDLGIYHQDGIGRFNDVATHHEFYRQGICQTLVYSASLYALEKFKVNQLVIVADDFCHAINAYKKTGFYEYEKNLSLMWYDRSVYGDIV